MAEVFNINPSAYVDMNDLFPELSDKVGLSSEQWRKAIENANYLYNHLGLSNVEVGNITTKFIEPGTLADIEVTHREVTVNNRTTDYFDFIFYIPSPKINATMTSSLVGSENEVGLNLIQTPIYGIGTNSNVIVGYNFAFDAKLLGGNFLKQVEIMPEASAEHYGKIVMYTGETQYPYVKGDLYECKSYTSSISGDAFLVYIWVDLNNDLQFMPESTRGYEDRIVRYVGLTNEKYTYGKFYEYKMSEISGSYGGYFAESTIYATTESVENAIQSAILDSWEAEY